MPTLKEKLSSGLPVLGTFLQIPAAEIAEIVAIAGFDCAIADTEHGMFGVDVGLSLVRACDAAGMASVLRVPGVQEHRITQALDFGASAVMIPNVKTGHDAERAVIAAKFHPDGQRGVCPFTRGALYNSIEDPEYYHGANSKTAVVLQIEAAEGVANLDEILAVPHIDCVFVGPFDLSQSLGIPGQVEDKRVFEALEGIIARAERRGVAVGNFAVTIDQAHRFLGMGVKFLAYGADTLIIARTFRDLRNSIFPSRSNT
jgi:4-hydroxy-2-oxoheptanedioate aldolase